ncbi:MULTISPECIES: hypothetical protein [unclassified Streptomyces]
MTNGTSAVGSIPPETRAHVMVRQVDGWRVAAGQNTAVDAPPGA